MVAVHNLRIEFWQIILALFSLFMLCSCEDVHDYNITEVTTGSISATITLPNGKIAEGINVQLYNGFIAPDPLNQFDPSRLLQVVNTSTNGSASFNSYAEGNYTLVADPVKYNNQQYRIVKYVKVSSSVEKKISINLADYTSRIKFTLVGYSNLNPTLKNDIIILILPTNLENKYTDINDLKSIATSSLVINEQGYCYADVPACQYYSIFIYRLSTSLRIKLGDGYFQPNQTKELAFYI